MTVRPIPAERPVIRTTRDITCTTPSGISRRPSSPVSSEQRGTEPKVLPATLAHPKPDAYPSRKPNRNRGADGSVLGRRVHDRHRSAGDRQSARPPPAPTIRSFRVPVTGRCFNSAGLENLLEPVFPDEPADMFYTAMETHRPAVEGLIKAVGLRPIHLSPDAHQVATLWFTLALGQERGRHVAFRVLQ